jgi:hypothetical protein
MCFAGQPSVSLRLAVVSDSASPRNLELMLLGWPGVSHLECGGMLGCTPTMYYLLGTVPQPWRQWMFGLGYAPPLASTVGSLLPCLCCTLCCVLVNAIHAFPFQFKPSCCYWKL